MSDPINFRRAAKRLKRAEAGRQADARAAKFGRTKAQRKLEEAQADQARKTLDGAKRERD